mmetsp:Transcript_45952/g.131175  ORF Transcript_45952/g.131175 Transcript_45952/m.131175 type:complete len:208 (-) Transcript_45952:742-1365(-)
MGDREGNGTVSKLDFKSIPMDVFELEVTPTTTTERRTPGTVLCKAPPSSGRRSPGSGPRLWRPSLKRTSTWCVWPALPSACSHFVMMFTAAATPSEMLVWPCGGSLAARIAAGEAKASPRVVAVWENTVNEQGPFATVTSSEKHSRASWVRPLMLPLLSRTKWKRVGGRCLSAGCSASKVRPITQVFSSSQSRRARTSGRPSPAKAA